MFKLFLFLHKKIQIESHMIQICYYICVDVTIFSFMFVITLKSGFFFRIFHLKINFFLLIQNRLTRPFRTDTRRNRQPA